MSKPKKRREIRDYLNDILTAIKDIRRFTKGVSYDEIMEDKKTLYAVIRCLEILGESVKNIPESIRGKYPEIPWQEIAGMRDKLIHEYFGVDMDIIWDTLREDDLTLLKNAVTKIIRAYHSPRKEISLFKDKENQLTKKEVRNVPG